MSLLSEAMETCTMYDKVSVDDGYGGFNPAYVLGAKFQAAIVVDDSQRAYLALSEGAKEVYTVTTERAVNLQFHDVFKRNSDGKIFRVLNDGDDKKTPQSAGLNMRQVRAEEWSIPNE